MQPQAKKKSRSRTEMIQAEIDGLERSREATLRLRHGFLSLAGGIQQIGDAIVDMLLVGTNDQLIDAIEHLELHKPKIEDLVAATEKLQLAESYLERIQTAAGTVPEQFQGLIQMMLPMIEMQVQMQRGIVQSLREELEEVEPLPGGDQTDPDSGFRGPGSVSPSGAEE